MHLSTSNACLVYTKNLTALQVECLSVNSFTRAKPGLGYYLNFQIIPGLAQKGCSGVCRKEIIYGQLSFMPILDPGSEAGCSPDKGAKYMTNENRGRDLLPTPDQPYADLIKYDEKDPEAVFPKIEQLRPPEGAPNMVLAQTQPPIFTSVCLTRCGQARTTALTCATRMAPCWIRSVSTNRIKEQITIFVGKEKHDKPKL